MDWRQTPEQKIDILYNIIGCLLTIAILLAIQVMELDVPILAELAFLPLFLVPSTYRRKKRYQKIIKLMEQLNISTDELQEETGASKYDLAAWKKGFSNTTSINIYKVEEYLQNKYFLQNGREFGQ